MKTLVHYYCFSTRNPQEASQHSELTKRLRAEIESGTRGREMHAIPTQKDYRGKLGAKEVEIETTHLFSNQWNTVNERVFDWFEAHQHEHGMKHMKCGHWVELTPEMIAIRRSVLKCGYTGQQFPASAGLVFNETPEGLGNEYLKESELHLLRLLPINRTEETRQPLTPEEAAYLMPKYRAAQKEGAATRAGAAKARARADVLSEFTESTTISEKKLRSATVKRDGLLWLLDRGFSTDNVIYYEHTGKFCFGWRNPLTAQETSALLDVLSEFPFEYEFHKNSNVSRHAK